MSKLTIDDELWGRITDYYMQHSSTETIEEFGLSLSTFNRLLKKHNFKKPKNLVYQHRNYDVIKSEEYQTNRKVKNLERFGYVSNLNTPEVMKKAHSLEAETKRSKSKSEYYKKAKEEDPNYWDSRNIKSAKTKLERYGDPNYNNSDKNYETNLANHNGKYFSGVMKYKFNNELFDSLPELALYIYAKDHNETIIRLPKIFYFDFNGKQHKFLVDFMYNDQYVEIKGDHFFKEDGTMQNPFDHSEDPLSEAKHQCGLNNNVKFWRSKDYKFAIDYFNENYNKEDFLND